MSAREKSPVRSPTKAPKRKTSKSSPENYNAILGFDPLTSKAFLEAEEEMKKDHFADYQIFLDVPEVHPDYCSTLEVFRNHFLKQFGNDPIQYKKLWKTFWYENINKKKEEEWETKRKMLLKQYHIEAKYKKLKETKLLTEIEVVNLDSNVVENKHTASVSSNKSNSNLEKHDTESPLPCDHHEKNSGHADNSSVLSSCRNSVFGNEIAGNASFNNSLDLLEDVCDSLGDVFGSVLRRVIKKIKDLKSSEEIISFLNNKDTSKLLKWSSTKLKGLSLDAEGAEKNKLIHCSKIASKLLAYGAEGTWNEKFNGLDIDKVAEATYNKDIPFTLAVIKESLKFCGVDSPSSVVIYSIFTEVSSRHVRMVLDD